MNKTNHPDYRNKIIYSGHCRHLSQLLIFVIFILALCLAGCSEPKEAPKFYPLEQMAIEADKAAQPENVEYFKNGQIITPDYAIPETLIVINAAALNYDMGRIEQGLIEATDGEISTVFYKHCKTLNK